MRDVTCPVGPLLSCPHETPRFRSRPDRPMRDRHDRRRRHVDLRQLPESRRSSRSTASTSTTPGWTACSARSCGSKAAALARSSRPTGSMLTNHHCARDVPGGELSSAQRRTLENGFIAESRARNEVALPEAASRCWSKIENVTAKVNGATAGLADAQANESRNADADASSKPACEAESQEHAGAAQVRIRDAVPGRPVLALQVQALQRRAPGVRARGRHRGVRRRSGQLPVPALVSRHVADARLRERQAGRARRTICAVNFGGPEGRRAGVRGRPSGQHRAAAHGRAAQVPARRSYLPLWLLRYSELRGRLIQFAKTSAGAGAHRRRTRSTASRTRIKVRRKQLDALLDDALMAAEDARRSARCATRSPPIAALAASAGTAWDEIDEALRRAIATSASPYVYLEGGAGLQQRAVRLRARARARRRRARQAERASACASTPTRSCRSCEQQLAATCRSIPSSSR